MDMSLIFCMESFNRDICCWVSFIFSVEFPVAMAMSAEVFTLLCSSDVSCSIICFKSETACACLPVPLFILSAFSKVLPDTCPNFRHAFFTF